MAKFINSPDVARFSGLYSFISPETYQELGVDPDDLPLGAFPARDHPPFLPNRFGGNAYGLGFFEQSLLPAKEIQLLEKVDFSCPEQVVQHWRELNYTFKRLGLLIRFTRFGNPYYLIPRQYVAHYLVELQARADEIVNFLRGVLARHLTESLKVGILAEDSHLLLPELQNRVPHMSYRVISSLRQLFNKNNKFDALVLVGDPRDFVLSKKMGAGPLDQKVRDSYGYFAFTRFYELLTNAGELLILCDRPLIDSQETMEVRFLNELDYKRFLIYSHVYKTKRRYLSSPTLADSINRFDFNAFLSGPRLYNETVEGLLEGRALEQVTPAELDALPYQNLELAKGAEHTVMTAWARWLEPFFSTEILDTVLPRLQKEEWSKRYEVDSRFSATHLVFKGRVKKAQVTLDQVQADLTPRRLAGCDPKLLANYKDSFAYVLKVLKILKKVREGRFRDLPGLELSRLRKPFETFHRIQEVLDVIMLMEKSRLLARFEDRLNPEDIMGHRTPVLENLEKLGMMGLEPGVLHQLYLIVLGHSTMTRVTFGKLPETTLRQLTRLEFYRSLEEAVDMLRLFRLMSVAEASAAGSRSLTKQQARELFSLYDDAISVVSDPELDWDEIMAQRDQEMGGVQAKAMRKMLKLFDRFEFLDNWRSLTSTGPRQKEAMADYDPKKLSRIYDVVALDQQMQRFLGRFYEGDSTARPYFYRALLSCEMHGTGRLLPVLGPSAGFTLLWICVHLSERKLLNFNNLLDGQGAGPKEERLAKLRNSLDELTPEMLSPDWLTRLLRTLKEKGEAYIYGSGLYLVVEPSTDALSPKFIDAQEELNRLERDAKEVVKKNLFQVPWFMLKAMDNRFDELGRFLGALGRSSPLSRIGRSGLPEMARHLASFSWQIEQYILEQLLSLPVFAANLKRLLEFCPHIMQRLLPTARAEVEMAAKQARADKLGALYEHSLEGFQDMLLSHEAARSEFGPNAAGIVGVTPRQFEQLSATLTQVLEKKPETGLLLMLAILLKPTQQRASAGEIAAASPLTRGMVLSGLIRQDLQFLLAQGRLYMQIMNGEACLSGLAGVLKRKDPLLTEALFIFSVIDIAAGQEGMLTEDRLAFLQALQDQVRLLALKGTDARKAHQENIKEEGRKLLAVYRYLGLVEKHIPAASLRHLLETTRIPLEEERKWSAKGRLQAGMDRLLRLRGLFFINSLDLVLLKKELPIAFIYMMKGLRSMGETHFERDLYEGLRLHKGLTQLEPSLQEFLLHSLANVERPLRLAGFSSVAERLTYTNQVRLLFLGLVAAFRLNLEPQGPRTVSFVPLSRVIDQKFELINEAVTELNPADLMENKKSLQSLFSISEGLGLHWDSTSATLSVYVEDPVSLDRKMAALARTTTAEELKEVYHNELKELKLVSHSTMDYQERLESAYYEHLNRLGAEMLERVRNLMAAEEDLLTLEKLFEQAWQEGMTLPLSQDRQQSLRDLFEMNVERLRARLLEKVNRRLIATNTFAGLDALWEEAKKNLKARRQLLSKEFDLLVAELFDKRAREIRGKVRPNL
ncbi:hypothetical protein [Dethiosulfatarculus sandiegensis]|uniref:Uncharacterized protein n=1 Tax=Dethiosulfatarculus sandiegensis TaxID=1429043 RepID=A0A0D2HRV5_9BACT|nr:hypothetical protein [Dethiosulfatarculus sandiegensis]KIX13298.1 hypothetical protein X474_15095 [Dethiosulfatarculus sandiegensis]